MTLELNKLTAQVDDMGRIMADRQVNVQDQSAHARDVLAQHPEVTDEMEEKIRKARAVDEWRRGAIPKCKRLDESTAPQVNLGQHVLIAADGSQIYPDRHASATYYLLNTGTIVFRCGTAQAPTVSSTPEVFYADEDLYDEEYQLHTTDFVSAARNRREIEALADLAEAERSALGGDLSVPIVCVLDGPLLPWMRPDPENRDAILKEIEFFARQFARMKKAQAIPVGYVDRPGSANVLRILELVELPLASITREALREGRFRQLSDRMIYCNLPPGHRTGLFEPNSNTNERYYGRSGDRIAFVYANMARQPGASNAAMARLEVPGWVAADPRQLDIAQAALYANCEPVRYPYVLARAHELAVVTQIERAELERMLGQVMMRNGMMPEISLKAANKLLTSHRS